MSFSFHCPHCQRSLKANESIVGHRLSCPNCKKELIVPGAEQPVAPSMPSDPPPRAVPVAAPLAIPVSAPAPLAIPESELPPLRVAVAQPHVNAGALNTPNEPPALWEPVSILAWSFFIFTWGFGAFLLAKNWKALGNEQAAKRSMIWFYSFLGWCLLVGVLPDIRKNLFGFAVIIWCIWAWNEGRPQIRFVKESYGDEYPHKSWVKPIAIGIACIVLPVIIVGLSHK